MHIDRAGSDFCGMAPDAGEQLRAGENASGLFHQVFKQAEIRWPETHVPAGEAHTACVAIQLQIAGDQPGHYLFSLRPA